MKGVICNVTMAASPRRRRCIDAAETTKGQKPEIAETAESKEAHDPRRSRTVVRWLKKYDGGRETPTTVRTY